MIKYMKLVKQDINVLWSNYRMIKNDVTCMEHSGYIKMKTGNYYDAEITRGLEKLERAIKEIEEGTVKLGEKKLGFWSRFKILFKGCGND